MIHTPFRVPGPFDEVIRGDLRMPEGPPPRSAIVVVHGFKGFKDWGFFPHACVELAAAGFAVVSFNFSRNGIGESPEELTELEAFATNTYTRELDELLWILDRVAAGDLVPRAPDSLGLLGHSRGGAEAVLAASVEPRVESLVTWAAVGRLDRWTEDTKEEWRRVGRVYVLNGRTGQQMPLDVAWLTDFEEHAERLDVGAAAGAVSAPWLIVHGTDDVTVDVRDAHGLVARATNARLHEVAGAGHTFGVGHPFEAPSPLLTSALDATVRHMRAHLASR